MKSNQLQRDLVKSLNFVCITGSRQYKDNLYFHKGSVRSKRCNLYKPIQNFTDFCKNCQEEAKLQYVLPKIDSFNIRLLIENKISIYPWQIFSHVDNNLCLIVKVKFFNLSFLQLCTSCFRQNCYKYIYFPTPLLFFLFFFLSSYSCMQIKLIFLIWEYINLCWNSHLQFFQLFYRGLKPLHMSSVKIFC